MTRYHGLEYPIHDNKRTTESFILYGLLYKDYISRKTIAIWIAFK